MNVRLVDLGVPEDLLDRVESATEQILAQFDTLKQRYKFTSNLLVKTVGDRSSRQLVDDSKDVHPEIVPASYVASAAWRFVEVSRHCDDSVVNGCSLRWWSFIFVMWWWLSVVEVFLNNGIVVSE